MKVLHLIQKPQLRGAEIFTAQLSSHLNESGCQAMIVSLFQGKSALPFNGQMIHLECNNKRRFFNFGGWKKLADIIRTEQPDIIQANAGFTLKFAVFSRLLFRWKQPIVFRNASTLSLYIKSRVTRRWNGIFFSYTSRVISVSHNSAMDFVKLFPKYHNRVCTIPVGIEEGRLDIPVVKKENGPVLIHVGGFTFEKNHEGLISIFQKLLKEVPDAKLWLVGDGPLRKGIEEECRRRNLESSVTFFGFRENAMNLIGLADLLVLPSIIEGLPATILEAFYCKVPVVAYDVGGIPEILNQNVTGWRVKLHDEENFVKSIKDALTANGRISSIVNNAYDLVTQRYLNRNIAEKFMNVYQSILASEALPYQTHNLN